MTDNTNTEKTDQGKLAKVRALIKDIDLCMLTTIDEHGHLHSRPMSNNRDVDFNGDLYFYARGDSHKALEIEREHFVNVAFANPEKQAYVSLSGTAELIKDRAELEKHWTPSLDIWFPDGIDTPGVVLIKVEAISAEYWEAPGKIATAFGIIRGLVTKTEPDFGENESVKLD